MTGSDSCKYSTVLREKRTIIFFHLLNDENQLKNLPSHLGVIVPHCLCLCSSVADWSCFI